MKSLLRTFAVAALGLFGSVMTARGTVWIPNPNKTINANPNTSFTDMSYWVRQDDKTVGSGAPMPTDDFIVTAPRLRINSTPTFTGNSLQIGDSVNLQGVVQDAVEVTFQNDGLKLANGYWWFNARSKTDILDGPVTVLSEDEDKPFALTWGNGDYVGQTAQINGPVRGSERAQLVFGPGAGMACAKNSTFILNDATGYRGTISVASAYANKGTDFGTCVRFANMTTSAKVNVRSGGGIQAATADGLVTVKELHLSDGARLNITSDRPGCFRATDALTLEGKVQIYWTPIVRGAGPFRFPVLAGPASSAFAVEDFEFVYGADLYNLDLHPEVAIDDETGMKTLYLVLSGFVYLNSNKNDVTRSQTSGGYTSFTTPGDWTPNIAPVEGTSNTIFRTINNMRTPTAVYDRYVFQGGALWLQGNSQFMDITQTFEVPVLYLGNWSTASCNGPTIFTSSWSSDLVMRIIAPHIHTMNGDRLLVRTFQSCTLSLEGEIDGGMNIEFYGYSGTSFPKNSYALTGLNTNFTGSISVSQEEYRDQYISFDEKYPTLFIHDGRNLGGRKETFDPRALKLTHMARLSVTNGANVLLADGLNRGVYILEKGRFHVTDGGTIDIDQPLLLSGKMWKEGDGTLVLRKGLKHEVEDGGELTDIPRDGLNLFEIVSGEVQINHADALSGVETTIDAGASIRLVADPDNADLCRYGIRNTTVDNPFVLNGPTGMKLPISIDVSALPVPTRKDTIISTAILTVKDSAVSRVRAMLPNRWPSLWKDYRSSLTTVHDDEQGITTFVVESSRVKFALLVR